MDDGLWHDLSNYTKSDVDLQSKGKAIPLQAWTSPEGSRRLKLPDFKTIGRKYSSYSFLLEAESFSVP
jgi:hypothetical protein